MFLYIAWTDNIIEIGTHNLTIPTTQFLYFSHKYIQISRRGKQKDNLFLIKKNSKNFSLSRSYQFAFNESVEDRS